MLYLFVRIIKEDIVGFADRLKSDGVLAQLHIVLTVLPSCHCVFSGCRMGISNNAGDHAAQFTQTTKVGSTDCNDVINN